MELKKQQIKKNINKINSFCFVVYIFFCFAEITKKTKPNFSLHSFVKLHDTQQKFPSNISSFISNYLSR